MITQIYGLVDPISGQLRYIGQTMRPLQKRLIDHTSESRTTHTHKSNWIRTLLSRGLVPGIILIQEVDDEIRNQAEIFWIAYFIGLGCPLTNCTEGGEGWRGYRHSEESKLKMSLAKKGKNTAAWTEERKDKLRKPKAPLSEAHKEHCRQAAPRTAILDQDGQWYPSIRAAARKLGLNRTCIWMVLEGRLKTTGNGYTFTRVK